MKSLKLKAAVAAVAFALAAPAQAALTGTDMTTGSSLFLTVWNSTTSYVRNLGLLLSDLTQNTTSGDVNTSTGPNAAWVSESGFTFSSAGDALFQSLFTGGLTDVQWNIASGENTTTGRTHLAATFDVPAPSFNTQVNNIASTKIPQFATSQNNDSLLWVSGSCAAQNSCGTTDTGGVNFGGNTTVWGPNLATTNMPDTAADGAEAISFWFAKGGSSNLAAANLFQFKNSAFNGLWTLASDGTVTYDLQAAVAPIPVPGAVWLLASGLLGFGAVARRRKQLA